jgi:hypothetical protein
MFGGRNKWPDIAKYGVPLAVLLFLGFVSSDLHGLFWLVSGLLAWIELRRRGHKLESLWYGALDKDAWKAALEILAKRRLIRDSVQTRFTILRILMAHRIYKLELDSEDPTSRAFLDMIRELAGENKDIKTMLKGLLSEPQPGEVSETEGESLLRSR